MRVLSWASAPILGVIWPRNSWDTTLSDYPASCVVPPRPVPPPIFLRLTFYQYIFAWNWRWNHCSDPGPKDQGYCLRVTSKECLASACPFGGSKSQNSIRKRVRYMPKLRTRHSKVSYAKLITLHVCKERPLLPWRTWFLCHWTSTTPRYWELKSSARQKPEIKKACCYKLPMSKMLFLF